MATKSNKLGPATERKQKTADWAESQRPTGGAQFSFPHFLRLLKCFRHRSNGALFEYSEELETSVVLSLSLSRVFRAAN